MSYVLSPAGFNKGDHSSVRAVSPDGYIAGISTEEIDCGMAAILIKDPADDGRGEESPAGAAGQAARGGC